MILDGPLSRESRRFKMFINVQQRRFKVFKNVKYIQDQHWMSFKIGIGMFEQSDFCYSITRCVGREAFIMVYIQLYICNSIPGWHNCLYLFEDEYALLPRFWLDIQLLLPTDSSATPPGALTLMSLSLSLSLSLPF